jgi:hypothetical protein
MSIILLAREVGDFFYKQEDVQDSEKHEIGQGRSIWTSTRPISIQFFH